MGRHRLAVVAALAVVAVECGGGPVPESVTPVAAGADVVAVPASDVTAAPPAGRQAPAPAPAPVEATPTAPALPATVDPVRPDIRVDGAPPDAEARVEGIEGVEAAVMVGSLEAAAPTRDGLETIEALVVDVDRFRRFTPDVTANEVGVWERLADGEAVFTSAAANRVGAVLGETATLSGPRVTEALRVGALAANGLPQLADVLVATEVGARLGGSAADTLLVAVADDADSQSVLHAVAESVGGDARLLEEPAVQQQPAPSSVGSTTLEPFDYQSVGDGTIRIDPGWVARNIVTVELPILGRVTCHRAIVDQMAGALRDIEAAGLGGEIYQYSGCWVPRHKLWDPSRGISRHAWGLAFDINVPTNQYGAAPSLHPGIVDAFRRWGFTWGGDFSTPDGMHFELERVVTP